MTDRAYLAKWGAECEPMDGVVMRSGAHHVTFSAGKFGWWVGVLRKGSRAFWQCGHQHEDRGVALNCSRALVCVLKDMAYPIEWNADRKERYGE